MCVGWFDPLTMVKARIGSFVLAAAALLVGVFLPGSLFS